jgi:hypothetical protein
MLRLSVDMDILLSGTVYILEVNCYHFYFIFLVLWIEPRALPLSILPLESYASTPFPIFLLWQPWDLNYFAK